MKVLLVILLLLSTGVAYAQTITMKVGQKQQLTPTGRFAGAPANWVSSDARVVTVINSADPKLNGTVIARKVGTATVTAIANGGSSPVAVTVTK